MPPRTSLLPTRRARGARSPRRLALLLAAAALVATALSGCAGTVALDPATDATDPSCADVIVRLPDTVADAPRRDTDAQATGAWGDPSSVILHCGVTPPGPTTLPCDSVNGIDWIQDDSQAPNYQFTTFGRTPAISVVVDSNAVSATSALVDLTNAVQVLPQAQKCLNLNDVYGSDGSLLNPTDAPNAPGSTDAPDSTGDPFATDVPQN